MATPTPSDQTLVTENNIYKGPHDCCRRGRWTAGPSEAFELVETSAALQLMENYGDSHGSQANDPFDPEGPHPRCAKFFLAVPA